MDHVVDDLQELAPEVGAQYTMVLAVDDLRKMGHVVDDPLMDLAAADP